MNNLFKKIKESNRLGMVLKTMVSHCMWGLWRVVTNMGERFKLKKSRITICLEGSAGVGRLPWWLGVNKSTRQCRRHRFDPWSGNIPHTLEQLSPCVTTIESMLQSLGTTTTQPMHCNHWSPWALELILCNKRSYLNKKSTHCN